MTQFMRPMMHRNARLLLILLAATFSVFLIWENTISNPGVLSWNQWAFYEWLINYQAGFVRRGLIGETIWNFAYGHEVEVINYLVFILGLLFVLFSTWIAAYVNRKSPAGVLYIFAPTGFFWMAVSNEYYYRKEMVFYIAIFISSALYFAWRKNKTRWVGGLLLVIVILSTLILPFMHEAFLFFCGLYFSMLLYRVLGAYFGDQVPRNIVFLFAAVNIVIFLALSVFKGGPEESEAIWLSLSSSAKSLSPAGEISGGINAVSWSTLYGISQPARTLLSGLGTYYLFPLFLVFLVVGYIFSGIRECDLISAYRSRLFLTNFMFVFITFVPLFIVGWDWGRWVVGIFFVLSTMVVTGLMVPAFEIPEIPNAYLNASVFSLILILSFFTRTPECCISASGGSLTNNSLAAKSIPTLKRLLKGTQ